MPRKILVMGLPRAGKTTLAAALAPLLRAVCFDAGDVRGELVEDPKFSGDAHAAYARHMGWLCDQVVRAGHYAVAGFICPTPEARAAFGDAYTVYLNPDAPAPYPEMRAIFVPPFEVDYEIREQNAGLHARMIARRLLFGAGGFDWHKPAALFVGRFRSFTASHRARVLEAIAQVGQACIAVCDTEDVDAEHPFGLITVRERIEITMAGHLDKIAIVGLPNITDIVDDRDMSRTDLPAALQAFSGGKVRAA